MELMNIYLGTIGTSQYIFHHRWVYMTVELKFSGFSVARKCLDEHAHTFHSWWWFHSQIDKKLNGSYVEAMLKSKHPGLEKNSNPVEVTGNYSLIKRSLYLVNNKPLNKDSQHLPMKGGLLNERRLKTCPSEPALWSWLWFLCVCCWRWPLYEYTPYGVSLVIEYWHTEEPFSASLKRNSLRLCQITVMRKRVKESQKSQLW